MEIATGRTKGYFPPRALRLVREWYALHRNELLENWWLAAQHKRLKHIEPLE